MRQVDKEYLNVGFDRNSKMISSVFYSMDKVNWNKSQVDTVGALMIRPIFVSPLNKKVELKELSERNIFEVYPNPSKGKIFIQSEEFDFKLLDIQGRELLSFRNDTNGVDISDFSSGVYFIIETKTGTSQKIIIE